MNEQITRLSLVLPTIGELETVAAQILAFAPDERIFLFYGDMGAGKTTLIKTLCEALGISEPATSPTFSIVNEYTSAAGKIFHFDFYRLKNQTEALDMGYEEYFCSGAYCFVEWPEKIPGLLPEHYLKVQITVNAGGSRAVVLTKN